MFNHIHYVFSLPFLFFSLQMHFGDRFMPGLGKKKKKKSGDVYVHYMP